MTRWLLTGGRGMLGQDMAAAIEAGGDEVMAPGSAELDITDTGAVNEAVGEFDVVVNCAAWTAVDDAEAHEGQAFSINATGAGNIAAACAARDVRLVHISTDYVFDGAATSPYAEDALQQPRTAYGRTKCAGEWAVRSLHPEALVVRTAWLYGAGGPNFVATMARLAAERERLSVVDDQRGQPTWTVDLADLVLRLIRSDASGGYWHGVGGGETTWWGFARAIFEGAGWDIERVGAVDSSQLIRPAPRPAYSVLGTERLRQHDIEPLRDWSQALKVALPTVLR